MTRKFCKNRARDDRGNYIGKIPFFFSFGGRKPPPLSDQGEIWRGGADLWSAPPRQIHLDRCNVSPLRGEKPKNRP